MVSYYYIHDSQFYIYNMRICNIEQKDEEEDEDEFWDAHWSDAMKDSASQMYAKRQQKQVESSKKVINVIDIAFKETLTSS